MATLVIGYLVRYFANARAEAARARWRARAADIIDRKMQHRVDAVLGRTVCKFLAEIFETKLEMAQRAQLALKELMAFERDSKRGVRLRDLARKHATHAEALRSAAAWTDEAPPQVGFEGTLAVLQVNMASLMRSIDR